MPAPAAHVDSWIVLFFATSLPHACLTCGLLGVIVRWRVLIARGGPDYGLGEMISAFSTAGAFPVGLFLIVCSFDTHLTAYLDDFYLALASAGIASLYLAYKGLFG